MPSPDDRRYLESHEWHKAEGDLITIGLSQFAVSELTDITYLEITAEQGSIAAGDSFGEIESVKAVADLNSPLPGEVVEVNKTIEDHLQVLARDPWDKGWLIRVKPDDTSTSHLLDAEGYEASLGEADA